MRSLTHITHLFVVTITLRVSHATKFCAGNFSLAQFCNKVEQRALF